MKTRFWAYICVLLIVLLGGASASLTSPQQATSEASTAAPSPQRALIDQPSSTVSQQQALIDKYCVGCHNERVKTSGLALNDIDLNNVSDKAEIWEKVVRKLRARYMPPVGLPRPSDHEYDGLIALMEAKLDKAASANPEPGTPSALRRLNRTEYKNAIRDILALDIDAESLLPKDDATYGFDNIDPGGLSPMLLERYVSAAQKISRLAMGSLGPSPDARVVIVPADRTQERHVAGLPLGTRGGIAFKHDFPRNGEYALEMRLTRDRDEIIEGLHEPHRMVVLLDGEIVKEFTITPEERKQFNETDTKAYAYIEHPADADLNLRIPVKAGPHEVAVTFAQKPSIAPEKYEQPFQANYNQETSPRTQPALYMVSVTGPFSDTGIEQTPSRQKILTCQPTRASEESACAKQIISRLLRAAYRRPITDVDLQMPLAAYQEGRAEGGFEYGIEKTLRRILVNPAFLYRFEEGPASAAQVGKIYQLSDLELASRLSFFLWSSIPDEELLRVAENRELSQPAVLEEQVKRMLRDGRAEALVTSFADQWLYLRNLEASTPDPELYPDFDDNLRQAFRRETQLLFEYIMREDRNVLELLTADYTFVNERLAKHYEIPNVYGSRFRKVQLNGNSIRGGLLGHGSILTVTSYANRTNPVLRGKWVMENILGAAPPPPPPNVPPLVEQFDGKVRTMRERMAIHRANPACASCHNILDPIGLSMENLDPIGRWRDSYKGGTPIDSAGGLPDGTTYEGFAGLRQAVLKRPDSFVSTMTQRLMVYATGRGLEYYDAPTIRGIVRGASEQDYRFSSLITGVVNSAPFKMRRAQ